MDIDLHRIAFSASSSPMKCLLDLDGVMADLTAGACAAHGRTNPYEDSQNHGHYDLAELFEISDDEFFEPFDEAFWENLPLTPECFDIMRLLKSFFGEGNICILTSPIEDPSSAAGKIRWIQKHLPELRRHFLIGPKKHFAAHPGAVLVDDSDDNIAAFREHGGHAILVPTPGNSSHAQRHVVLDVLRQELSKLRLLG